MKRLLQVLALGLVALPLAGCNRQGEFSPVDMWNRSRIKTYEPVDFFPDRHSNRPLVPGTVARGQMFKADDAQYRGLGPDGRYINAVPAQILQQYSSKNERMLLVRGQERYQIYCATCHGASGHGDGMVVQRGFVPPPDYRIKRLRDAPLGHFYDVITNGYGAMYSYSSRIPMQDRWAISAYVRRLQEVQVDKNGKPEIVEDVRYKSRDMSRMYGSSGMAGSKPRNTTNTIGTEDNSGSSSYIREGAGRPSPKNPMQAQPQPGVMATPGLEDRNR
jgi:mono/diheme cytochrome c family protein